VTGLAPPSAFLAALHEGCEGLLELRALPSTARTFLRPGDDQGLLRFAAAHATENVYVAVATRQDDSNGTLENCQHLAALFADLDFKRTPETPTRARLARLQPPPSAVVHSGGGFHVYWFLREPLDLRDPGACVEAYHLLRRLAHALGGDPTVAEPARVLRLPGTVNCKPDYDAPRPVVLESLEAERRYNPSELDELLPAAPPVEGRLPVDGPRFTLDDEIPEGQRNATLFKLVRSLRARGELSAAEVADVLDTVNARRCQPPLPPGEVLAILEHAWTAPDRPDFGAARNGAGPDDARTDTAEPFVQGLGAFLARTYSPADFYIDGLLSDEGGGWVGGEDKLGKTYWALDEALALALGQKVAGVFTVPQRRRVLFIEEEDSPRRTHRRLRALLRGRGLDPDDPGVQAELDAWFHLVAWQGFTFDVATMVQRLEAELQAFAPDVVYVDVLRKVTLKDLNKAAEAGALLATLDRLSRTFKALFRVLHHYRKIQGSHRAGRGSQEIGGSFALGAWGVNRAFFEPVGRTQGTVRLRVQCKDAPPRPPSRSAWSRKAPATIRPWSASWPARRSLRPPPRSSMTRSRRRSPPARPRSAPAVLASASRPWPRP
jgi:hypothetical protein